METHTVGLYETVFNLMSWSLHASALPLKQTEI